MASVKKPLQTTIKVDSSLWKVITAIQELCGKEVMGKNEKMSFRKAQAGTVIDALLSALVETADANAVAAIADACVAEGIKDDRRAEFLGAVMEARQTATVQGIPDDTEAQRKLLEGLMLLNPDLVKSMTAAKK